MYACMYVCMYVCMYAYMYVYIYVCMYVICTNNYIKQGQVYRGGAGRAIAPPKCFFCMKIYLKLKKKNFCKFFT